MKARSDDKPEAPRPPESPARKRALDHLRFLLKSAAVGGAAAALSGAAPERGPVVCDPLPPPRCSSDPAEQVANIWSHAAWRKADDGWQVDLSLVLRGVRAPRKFDPNVRVEGAKLVSSGLEGGVFNLTLAPAKKASQAKVTVQVICDGRGRAVTFTLDLLAEPEEGRAIDVEKAP